MKLEDESDAIREAVAAVGRGGHTPLSERIYELVRLMVEDRQRSANEALMGTKTSIYPEDIAAMSDEEFYARYSGVRKNLRGSNA